MFSEGILKKHRKVTNIPQDDITSTVISFSNEDSDFFTIEKILRNAKRI